MAEQTFETWRLLKIAGELAHAVDHMLAFYDLPKTIGWGNARREGQAASHKYHEFLSDIERR